MSRVEILYDFDPASFWYYEHGLNTHPSKQFTMNSEPFLPIEEIKRRENIECLHHLGTGLDKICIADSKSNKCFILEPCSAAFFICAMEQTFEYLIKKIDHGKVIVKNGGIILDEMSYRINREHNGGGVEEICVGIEFELKDKEWLISFGKISDKKIITLKFESFLSAYFEFGERMIRFYNSFIPQFEACVYQYQIFINAIRKSVIDEKFDFNKQSSYDELTYYDYQ